MRGFMETCSRLNGLFERRIARSLPTKIPSGGLCEWLQGHFVAQAFQSPDQGAADSVHVDPFKVVPGSLPYA
jgi:hypothetical protein